MAVTISVELDEAFLKKYFGLTDKVLPDGQEITPLMLRNQLDEIAVLLKDAQDSVKSLEKEKNSYSNKKDTQPHLSSPSFVDNSSSDDNFELNLPKKNIFVIDDLGVITYQLSVLFQQFNYEVVTSKEIYDAIEKFKKQNFDWVVMDLFIPTEREGFILLEELKKISLSKPKATKIGVMSASTKKEHKQLCKMKGAEFYIEKVDDWQKDLIRVIKEIK